MQHSVWLYPWDLIDRDLNEITDTLGEAGIGGVDLTLFYHGARAGAWGNPKRTFVQAGDGLAYFQPQHDLYGDLKPTVSPLIGTKNPVVDAAQTLVDSGIEVRAWTIYCFNRRMGEQRPDVCVQNPMGDTHLDLLCPTQEPVRDFFRAVTTDLARNTPVSAVSLEELEFTPFGFSSQVDKTGYPIDETVQKLLGLCFCDACRARMGQVADSAQDYARRCIETFMATLEAPDAHEAAQHLAPVLATREQIITEVVQMCATAAHEHGKSADAILGYTPDDGRWYGVDAPKLEASLAALTLLAYAKAPKDVGAFVERWRRVSGLPMRAGLTLVNAASEDELAQRGEAAAQAGGDALVFYNYGIVPMPVRRWMGRAVGAFEKLKG